MTDRYVPTPQDRFTFGLWTVGQQGRDPFGDPVRPPMDPIHAVHRLAELGAWGISLHDNDLVPFDATPTERDRLVKGLKAALDETGLVLGMATTNLFTNPVFKDGAFTSSDATVRAFAIQKAMRSIDIGAELGTKIYDFWGGREGSETDVYRGPVEALRYMREAFNFLTRYVKDQGYDMRFVIEPKPNEPRGHIYLPTVGHALHFITTLDDADMVGVNPEFAHDTMAGLNFTHAVGQAIDAGKLFHIDLNDQVPGRYDQDFRFASENLKPAFYLVRLLEESGYDGPRHFDAHPYRTEDEDGVWHFARGCMRSYLILRDKAKRFAADAEIQGVIAELRAADNFDGPSATGGYTAETAAALKGYAFDTAALAAKGRRYEELDQLVNELILGVR